MVWFCYQERSLWKSCLHDYGWREASESHVRRSASCCTGEAEWWCAYSCLQPPRLQTVSRTLTPSSRLSPAPPHPVLRESSLIVPQQCSSLAEVDSPYLPLALCWLQGRNLAWLQGEEPCMAAQEEPCMATWKEPCKRLSWFIFIALVFKLHGVLSLQLFIWRNGGTGESLTNIIKLDLGLDLGLWL